jgi:hypothetical protein
MADLTLNAPTPLSSTRVRISLLIRSLVFAFAILATDGLVDLGTNPYLLIGATALGIIVGAKATGLSLKTRGAIILAALAFTFSHYLLGELGDVFSKDGSFKIFSLTQHFELSLLFFLFGTISTVLFLRYRHAGTAELIILSGIIVYLLSPHRDYHLDSPQFIANLAWQLGLSPQAALLFVGSGAIAVLLILSAFIESSPLIKSTFEDKTASRRARLLHSLGAIGVMLVCLIIGKAIYSRYDTAQGLTTNGVGESNEPGSSPLGFHSALGSTNQPAALVRLEGDYSENPFTPMLYLREGALSLFNGQEMVIAGGGFDADIPNTPPTEVFSGTEDPDLKNRKSVTQSVYLLADQKTAYGIDYPISIKQLKNPDPDRFKLAFRSYSLAPTFKSEDLEFLKTGDPRWASEIWDHYTRAHPDSRYKDLALKLTEDSPAPIQKARSLLAYLAKNSIYTLTPKHETKPGEDPVAPYLFGDMRGYCVHFAHATVYMLRGLGIPSRIATGYLTDLSQAKDGHILLRMSDRHAWAEIYIQEKGWVPFDIQPEQVESAAETQVDMKLLEELMGKLDPGEEILPKEKDEDSALENEETQRGIPLPSARQLAELTLIILGIILIAKIYLRYSWLLPSSQRRKVIRAHRSAVINLSDIGIKRLPGETWNEFKNRASIILNGDALLTANLIEILKYAPKNKNFDSTKINEALSRQHAALSQIPAFKRILGFLNPAAVLGGI